MTLRICVSYKYETLTAEDGIEALHLLQNHEVNIIISDWMMPRMDGAELCRRVRQDQLTSHIPFIMLTAKTDDDSKVEGMDVVPTHTSKSHSLYNISKPVSEIYSRYVAV